MAIYITSSNTPKELRENIFQIIKSSMIDTWQVDSMGDFTHTPPQWCNKAWLRPYVVENQLIFGIIGRKSVRMTKAIYAIFHGRFAEMLLTHLDTQITDIKISSLPDNKYDCINVEQPPNRQATKNS